MPHYDLNPEQDMLRKTIRDFAEKEVKPIRQKLDEKEEFSYELVDKMGKLGLFGMTISEEYGGQGMDYLSYCIAVEELARVDGCQAATVAAENSLGIGPLYHYGNEEQKRKYLPDLCSGKKLWGFGLTEPEAGSDAGNSKTKAELKNGTWIINGSKIFITNAATKITAGITVQAITGVKDDKKEMSCIIVESNTKGFTARTMHNKMTWRSSNTAELYFDDVRVPEKNLLGARGTGFKQMLSTLDSGRLGIAAMGLGGAQGAFEAALSYAQERKVFGKPISSFQVNAFKLADCAMEIEAARGLLYKACWLKDEERPFGKEASMAKLYCSEVFHRVANHCVQLHGGYGLMEEYPAAKFYRDQKLLEIGEGTSEIQRLVISRYLGC
ncbi:MAG: acyl-CoA dehydrogenase [Deltaproteobacteria bacterium RIFCSPLOWO2_12_FULL_40_28]|nr:MAG: acyl-CoA dehydrogenase [Deltaproteobacteria bacterium RIFCSPHIGHO2_02_FULL_40_28]OGQ20853.1 MAG: acyl-CoA dehydrogenase [Deltaproteobacteria bacterium RIFCSPHIGHO2_12_FULL_40_32]OGQ39254.1 MAG: acyl-CoA dehydrogenase [Deltaproteobacteria bacterium RIFCSPLOWO2_02_FULL_40_36]OGQ54535.1 MAG: acyl-CoA dehydrogenase [Deltaproteobacteria bacterium RIFCSPLOWO2_12_FULL_40_28]